MQVTVNQIDMISVFDIINLYGKVKSKEGPIP